MIPFWRAHTRKQKKRLHFRVLLLNQARLITASFIKKDTHTSLFYAHLQRYMWKYDKFENQ